MKQAIGYVRVSTDKQAIDGVSIEAQSKKIEQWAFLNDYELVAIYCDKGISGKRADNRPELNKALGQLKKGMAFVFYSLSRVSRNTIDTIKIGDQINACGADMVSLSEKIDTTGASGRMIFNLLAVLNQFERDQISERVKLAMQHLKSTDQVYSPIPYGYMQSGNQLIEDPNELSVIQKMQDMAQLGYGYRKIATTLNKQGIKSKKGGLWYAKTVQGVLDRQKKR